MATSFSVSLTISFPPDEGQPAASHTYTLSDTFNTKDDDVYNITGAGTTSITLKSKAKLILIKLAAATVVDEVTIKVNGEVTGFPLTTGGAVLVASPSPDTGIDELEVTTTGAVKMTVIALGA